jgi:hypothetical protein
LKWAIDSYKPKSVGFNPNPAHAQAHTQAPAVFKRDDTSIIIIIIAIVIILSDKYGDE